MQLPPMSPQTKRRAALNTLLFTLGVTAAFGLATKSLGYAAASLANNVANTYVRADTFNTFRAQVAEQREHESRRYERDSLVRAAEYREIIASLRRLDTTMRTCIRHADVCQ